MAAPQVGRFNRLLGALLSLKEPLSPSMLEDYFPTLDLFAQVPELFHTRDERVFHAGSRGLGGVGLQGRCWLMNKKPDLLVMVDGITIGYLVGGGSFVDVNLTTGGLPADGAGGQSNIESGDSRDGVGVPGTTPKPGATVANDQTGAPAVGGIKVIAAASTYYPCRFVLRTGYALVVTGILAGAGTDICVTFHGYERNVEPSELR